ncbi:hypothetical protein [Rhodovulum sulfidophilum]|uniref:hypothetical protein n=1 Tax=Rhodovulum sulfidophilum TaxID=35806 RepID=UPI001921A97E|nr:hypothetical protein [Rhodovulum sulfidophilum]MBL3561976.1 hypothetical protein [Rhodovulum sulfidophilum]
MNTHLHFFPDCTHDHPVPVGLPIHEHWRATAAYGACIVGAIRVGGSRCSILTLG